MGLISCGDSEADNPPVKPHDKSFAAAKACHSGNQGQLGSDNLIAHAGGLYQGSTYTNSLEAMNHSYLLGFRLIGIDYSEPLTGIFSAPTTGRAGVKGLTMMG